MFGCNGAKSRPARRAARAEAPPPVYLVESPRESAQT